MVNPYRENSDKIEALVRRLSREHLYTVVPDPELMQDSIYPTNHVVGSTDYGFEQDLEQQLKDLMKEATDVPITQDM